jgi:Tripartite tricarboxylate transporter family receptor
LPWQSSIAGLTMALLAARAEPTGARATAMAIRPARRSRYILLFCSSTPPSSTHVVVSAEFLLFSISPAPVQDGFEYRGAAPAMQDLVGGHVDLMFDQPPNSLPHVRDGNIKAYAVTGKVRLASAPDIPTVDEAGLPGFHVTVWSGLWAPKGTAQCGSS